LWGFVPLCTVPVERFRLVAVSSRRRLFMSAALALTGEGEVARLEVLSNAMSF
jgi:hypothetical protein